MTPTAKDARPIAASPHPFRYTDGDAIENRLLDCLSICKDVSAFSAELRACITDWPSNYHFNPSRHNLLRPFSFTPGMRILELGCGCGAITRYLGETGATVIAVEGSTRRAEIARERCRDLPNVSIQCANLMDYRATTHFDHVLLIGVLEYAQQYVSAPDPIRACLEHAGSFLNPSGTLILAIENQLGLKYFNGCDEDHVGIPYYGVHGLYDNAGPRTFGKRALEKRLAAAGFIRQEFFYPFPDYKLPSIIIADAALAHPEFSIASLLCRSAATNRHGTFTPAFMENMAWSALAENGLLGDLANSLLVLAGKHDIGTPRNWLAHSYATDRLPRFTTETRFTLTEKHIRVDKRPLAVGSPATPLQMPQGELQHAANETSDYVTGEIYLIELQRILGRGGGLKELVAWAVPWMAFLMPKTWQDNGRTVLDGALLDAIPSNLIRGNDDTPNLIDHEWRVTAPVPLAWVLVRGLFNAIAASPTSPALANMTYRQVIAHVADRLTQAHGLQMGDLFAEANLYENALRGFVFGTQIPSDLITSSLDKPAVNLLYREMLLDMARRQELALIGYQTEVTRLKSTASWQLTKPLRLLANLPRLLRDRLFPTSNKNHHAR